MKNQGLQPRILPVSAIENYNCIAYVWSDMKLGWAHAFAERRDHHFVSFGLEEEFLPSRDCGIKIYPILSKSDEFIQARFGFDPKSYLQIDGNHSGSNILDLGDLAKESIAKIMALSEKLGAKTVISLSSSIHEENLFYCSENVLDAICQDSKPPR